MENRHKKREIAIAVIETIFGALTISFIVYVFYTV